MAKDKDKVQDFAFKVPPGAAKFSLKDYDPGYSAGLSKSDGTKLFEAMDSGLTEIQELLYAAQQNSVLVVLQGMDTSGKDGTVSHVMSVVNPQGCRVNAFKAPTPEELAHDFLWRVHPHAPGKGLMEIFNRSHYEDVLVTRVHNLVPKEMWQQRYEQINAFEELLAADGTIILKFFLYIGQDEQAKRLQAREDDPDKRWKLSPGDYVEREYWDDYIKAYEAALTKCSTPHAPWYVIPANHKWYRNLAVAKVLADTLQPYKERWQRELEQRGARVYEQLQKIRVCEQEVSETSKYEG